MNANLVLINVTPDNVEETGVFCVKNHKAPGAKAKFDWFRNKLNKGLTIKIAVGDDGKQMGFIEYIPSEQAWRPVKVKNYMFVHCIALFSKKDRNSGVGSSLIEAVEKDARKLKMDGVCVMCSDGVWMANKTVFEKNGFEVVDQMGRFDLLAKKIKKTAPDPNFVNWKKTQKQYEGWHLLYADQCPWHGKSVTDLNHVAMEHDIVLNVTKLKSPKEAQNAPSGFGTFTLIRDGDVLADHYVSATRFKNILKKELV